MNKLREFLATALALSILTGVGNVFAQNDASSAAELPVTRVVLFTSGVGYFEHSGVVTDAQTLELSVGTEDMDDLLQSLVLQDLDGGDIRPVRYPSRAPLERILEGFTLDLSGDPTLADLLSQARGERVQISAASPIEGSIVNVEQIENEAEGRQTFLTLATSDGLTRISLAEVRQIRFEDATVQAELDAALATLADFRGEDTRTLRLQFEGTGERRVRIGYVREMPVWKTSYRLLLSEDGSADLQGWAIIDNPTDMDLQQIELSFVAGQPISFITGLYEPVYVDRPRVEVSTAPSIVPPQYSAAFAQEEGRSSAEMAAPQADAMGMSLEAAPQLRDVGVTAQADGVRTGATFVYRVTTPVSVGRHESAMVPIIQRTIMSTDVSVFDASVLAQRPLRGVRIVNDTGLHLAAGPITVFDEGGFTGNARIDDLLPGESRILTYAVDLELEVIASSTSEPERVTAVRFENGLIRTEIRQRIRSTYRIDSVGIDSRFLVIDHPKRGGFEVVSPDPLPAQTAEAYRFGVELSGTAPASDEGGTSIDIPTQLACTAGEPCVLEVVTERVELQQLAIANVSSDQILFFLENVELSDEDRVLLDQILTLQQQLAAVDRNIQQLEERRQEIAREQDRIRQNMGALDRNASLYRRYVTDLEQQEDEIDAIQSELETLRTQRNELQNELDALIRRIGETVQAPE